MATYYKADYRARTELPLWLIALELGLQPDTVLWKCRGKCYKKDMRDPPMTKHIRLVFPSGTIRYQCIECGSAVIFDDLDDERMDIIPEERREKYLNDYKHKIYKLRKGMKDRHGKT